MTTKVNSIKPFFLEEKKQGPKQLVSETSVNKWEGCILTNIKKDDKWLPFTAQGYTWDPKKTLNRGKDAATAKNIDAMLEYISQYAPNCLYRDITLRSKSLPEVWLLVRNWAGVKTSGCYQQRYHQVKRSFDSTGDISTTDFFFMLRDAKEDCLMKSQPSGGIVTFRGEIPTEDEELFPTLESDIVADWLEAIGGADLLEHVFRVFSKDLERETLADLRQRISDSMESLMLEVTQHATFNKFDVFRSTSNFQKQSRGGFRGRFNGRGSNRGSRVRLHLFLPLSHAPLLQGLHASYV